MNKKLRLSLSKNMIEMDGLKMSYTMCCLIKTQEQKNHILLAKSGTGILSLAMCLFAVSLVFCLRLDKYFTYRLAMYQILSSLCLSVVEVSALTLFNYDGDVYQQIACKTTAFLLEYFMWIKLLFTICPVFHLSLFCLAVCLSCLP